MSIRKWFIVICFVCIGMQAVASYYIDSLRHNITTAKTDIDKANALNSLALYLNNLAYPNDSAMICAQQAIDICIKHNYNGPQGYGYLNLGTYHQLNGDYQKSLNEYLKAQDIFEKSKTKEGLVQVYDKLNSFYREQMKNYQKALEYSRKEIDMSTLLTDKTLQATAYANRGNIYYDMNDLKNALQCYLIAQNLYDSLRQERNVVDLENNIGSVYSDLQQYDKAIEYYDKALASYQKMDSKADVAMCLCNIGNVFNMKGEMDKGIQYSLQSLALARKVHAKDIIAACYTYLAEGYSKQGDFKNAFDYQAALTNLNDSIYSESSSKQINDMQVKYDTEKKVKENQILTLNINRARIINYSILAGLVLVIALAFFVYRGYRDKKKANVLLEDKNKIIEEKNKDILDSINYAKTIQHALLTSSDYLKEALGEYFVLYRPRDVVSGDFYWCFSSGDKVIFTVADCTGHGVPGAFMSMIGNSLLNEVVVEHRITDAAKILDMMRANLLRTLQQKGQSITRDGMDIALCVWDKTKNEIQYAGANNPLYLVRHGHPDGLAENKNVKQHEGNIFEITPDKQPIGFLEERMDVAFKSHTIKLQKGDIVYITSDGYADQFGGESNKKFTKKRFREVLASFNGNPLHQQRTELEGAFEQWKSGNLQTDDICIMGVKFPIS